MGRPRTAGENEACLLNYSIMVHLSAKR